MKVADVDALVPPLEIGEPAVPLNTQAVGQMVIDVTPPLSSFHYQIKNVCFPPVEILSYILISSIAMASALLRQSGSQGVQDLHLLVYLGVWLPCLKMSIN